MTERLKASPVFVLLGMLAVAALLAVSVQFASPASSVGAQSFDEEDCELNDEDADEVFDDEELDELDAFCDDEGDDEDEDEDERDDEDRRDEDEDCDDEDDEDEDEDRSFGDFDEDEDEDDCDPRVVIIRRVPVITAPIIAPKPTVVAAAAPAPAPAPVAAAPAPAPQVQLPRTGQGPVQDNSANNVLPIGAGLILVAGVGLAYWRLSRSR